MTNCDSGWLLCMDERVLFLKRGGRLGSLPRSDGGLYLIS